MVKLYTTELGNKIVDRCLQMFGGYGYMEDFPIARAYRDARVSTIVGGTSQIMREIIAKMVIDDVRYKKVYTNGVAAASRVVEDRPSWGSPQTAGEIIESIPLRFKNDKASGISTTFHFDISGTNACQYTVKITNDQCYVSPGLEGEADCIVAADSGVYEDVELGRSSPEMAVMSGQLKVSNLGAMMSFVRLFKRLSN